MSLSEDKIDEKVVALKFDASQFERGVVDAQNNLKEFKKSFKFNDIKNSAKSAFSAINSVANNLTFGGLSSGIEKVKVKFSGLQVAAATAIGTIVSRATDAGISIAKSLTIEPILDGFHEYETQLNAVQTILANTKSKGSTIDDVNSALNELNTYADKTIYNFTEMTRNIGTFTAAGVDLDKATASIKGIANLAAVSGSNSMQASTAMYQLSQAISTGTVKLMDWNSVVNAGMGGEVFQEALKRTARNFGVDVDDMIAKAGSFRDSLQEGWITSDILVETLKQISGAYSEADLIAQGYSEDQAKAIADLANTATDAATKVKTATQLMDTLKEAVGSGWAQTWQIIFGDFEEAREMWTTISDAASKVIGDISGARNNFLERAMDSPIEQIRIQIENSGQSFDEYESALRDVVNSSGRDFDSLVAQYGDLEKATKAGVISTNDFRQAFINLGGVMKMANGEYFNPIYDKLNTFNVLKEQAVAGKLGDSAEEISEKFAAAGMNYTELYDLVQRYREGETVSIMDLTDAQLKSMGYTDEEINSWGMLAARAMSYNDELFRMLEIVDQMGGRQLIFKSILNIVKAIEKPLAAIGRAFAEVFNLNPESLYGGISAFEKFTETLQISDETAHNITTTFRGFFKVIKLGIDLIKLALTPVVYILGGALQFLGSVFAAIGSDGAESSAAFGGALSTLINVGEPVAKLTEKLAEKMEGLQTAMGNAGGAVGSFIKDKLDKLGNPLTAASNGIKTLGSNIVNYFEDVNSKVDWSNPIDGLNQFISIIGEDLKNAFTNLGNTILNIRTPFGKVSDILDSIWNSPFVQSIVNSKFVKAFEDFGKYLKSVDFSDPLEGIKNFFNYFKTDFVGDISQSEVGQFIDGIIEKFEELYSYLTGLDWSNPMEALKTIGGDILNAIRDAAGKAKKAAPDVMAGFREGLSSGLSTVIEKVGKIFQEFIDFVKDKLGIHSPSTVFEEIGENVDQGFLNGLNNGAPSIIKFFSNFFNNIGNMIKNFDLPSVATIAFSTSLVASAAILAHAVKPFAGVASSFSGIFNAISEKINGPKNKMGKFASFSKSILMIASAIGILASSLKLISSIPVANAWISVGIIAAMAGILLTAVIILVKVSKEMTKINIASVMAESLVMITFATAIGVLSVAMFNLSKIDTGGIAKGLLVIGVYTACLMLLAGISSVVSPAQLLSVSAMAILFSVAVGLLAIGLVTLAAVPWKTVGKALAVMAAYLGILVGVALVAHFLPTVGSAMKTIAMFSLAAILIAAGIFVLGHISPATTGKALANMAIFIGVLTAFSVVCGILDGAGGSIKKSAGTLLAFSASMVIMAIGIKRLAAVEPADVAKGLVIMTSFMLLMVMFVRLGSTKTTKNMDKTAAAILAMSISIGILGYVVQMLGRIDNRQLAKGLFAVWTLMAMNGVMMLLGKNFKPDTEKAIIAMAICISVMAAAVVILGTLDTASLAKGLSAVTILSTMAGVMMGMSENVPEKGMKTLLAMTAMIAVMGGITYMLGQFSWETLLSISVLFMSFAATLDTLSELKAPSKGAIRGMYAMAGVFAVIAVVLALINEIGGQVEMGIETAVSISMLMMAMSVSLLILGRVKKISPSALLGMYALGAVVLELGFFLSLLSGMDINLGIDQAAALSVLLIGMSAALVILQFVGVSSLIGVGALAALALVVLEIGWVLGVISDMEIDTASNKIQAVSDFLVAMSDVLGKLTYVGIFGPAALFGVFTLMTLIECLALMLNDFGKWVEENPDAESQIIQGFKIVYALGYGISQVSDMFSGGISDNISMIAGSLHNLGESLHYICSAFSELGGDGMAGIQSATGMLLALGAAEVGNAINNIVTMLPGVDDTSPWDSLDEFGDAMVAFSDKVTGIDTEAITAASKAASGLAELNNSLPGVGGVVQWFMGDKSEALKTFSEGIVSFGDGLVSFSDSVSGQLDTEAINAAVTASQGLVDLNEKLPAIGGVVGWFEGESDMALFGQQIASYGSSLVEFSNSVSGGNIDTQAIQDSVTASQGLVDLYNSLPDVGGFISVLGGDPETLAQFGTELESYGKSIVAYAISVIGLDTAAIQNSVTATQGLVDIAGKLPSDGPVWAVFTGGQENMATFGNNLQSFGWALGNYSKSITGLDTAQMESTTTAISNIVKVAKDIKDQGVDASYLDFLTVGGANGGGVGGAISGFYVKFKDVDTEAIGTAAWSIKTISDAMVELNGLDTTGVDLFAQGVSELAAIDFSGLTEQFTQYGTDLGTALGNGIGSASESISTGITVAFSGAGDFISGTYYDWFNALGSGLMSNLGAGMGTTGPAEVTANIGYSLDAAGTAITDKYGTMQSYGTALIDAFCTGVSESEGNVRYWFGYVVDRGVETIVSKTEDMSHAATTLFNALTDGVASQERNARYWFGYVVDRGVETAGASDKWWAMHDVGMNLVSGLVQGIYDNGGTLNKAMRSAVSDGIQAGRDESQIHSPSKVTYRMGEYLMEGMALGVRDYAKPLEDEMRSSTRNVLNVMSDFVDDMNTAGDDIYMPTITPVIDLSDVYSAADEINGAYTIDIPSNVIRGIQDIGGQVDVITDANRFDSALIADAIRSTGNTYNTNTRIGDVVANNDTAIEDKIFELAQELVRYEGMGDRH